MMEVENRLSERFDGLVDDLPDELNERRVDKNDSILEECEDDEEGLEMGMTGTEPKSVDGLHHPRGRIIRKVCHVIIDILF